MSIEQKIADLKKHFGWNNVELANAAGVTKQAVGVWLNHGSFPSQEALLTLRERYRVNDRWFYGKSDEMILSNDVLSDELTEILRNIQKNNLSEPEMKALLKFLKAFVGDSGEGKE